MTCPYGERLATGQTSIFCYNAYNHMRCVHSIERGGYHAGTEGGLRQARARTNSARATIGGSRNACTRRQRSDRFEATAFVKDVGFQPVKLSDYKGRWIVICFYPGDFTFV
jgi:hypothetical protein